MFVLLKDIDQIAIDHVSNRRVTTHLYHDLMNEMDFCQLKVFETFENILEQVS